MKQNVKKRQLSNHDPDSAGRIKRKLPLYWIGLLCFSSFWMFGLGVLVGRGYAPIEFDTRKLQNELAAISERWRDKEKKDLEQYADNLDNKAELDFYEELKQAEVEEAPEKAEEPETPADVPPEDIPVKKSLAKATKAQLYIQQTEPTESTESTEYTESAESIEPDESIQSEAPVEETPEDINFHWTVQVSSVKDPAAAERMVAKLKGQGYSAYSVRAETPGVGVWFRVRVGPYQDKNVADRQMTDLKQTGYDAFLISM